MIDKIYIFTEGGQNIGFGHITRCLSLYQALIFKGFFPKIIVHGDDSVSELLGDTNYQIINWLTEIDNILYKEQKLSIAIIDSYLASLNIYEIISKSFNVCTYIDDYNRIEYPKGIVVNGALSANSIVYKKRDNLLYLLGINYQPLRKIFWESDKKHIKENINSIMLTFGGDDIRNMTPNLLTIICQNFPDISKKVIIGKGFKNIDKIKNNSDKNTELIYYPDEEKIKAVMLNSDIAISAAGQTLYELAKVGTPTIAICVADNQKNNVKGWIESGIIDYAGNYTDKDMNQNLKQILSKMVKKNYRINKSIYAQKLIDGQGANRVITEIMSKLS